MVKILVIIPARSRSKSVKDKNIRLIAGKPMMVFSIEHALKSKYINRVIVSTDSEKYADIAREYGAETPFLRPIQYATEGWCYWVGRNTLPTGSNLPHIRLLANVKDFFIYLGDLLLTGRGSSSEPVYANKEVIGYIMTTEDNL